MPTIDDAVGLIASREYAAVKSGSSGEWVTMDVVAILRRLAELGAEGDAARLLLVQAADRTGSTLSVEHAPGGLRAGGALRPDVLVLRTPAGIMRD